jgi:hypothetical protein
MLQPNIAFIEECLGAGRNFSVSILGLLTSFDTAFVI